MNENARLLTKEEQNKEANAVVISEYPTSVDYWNAIIQAVAKAQLAKDEAYYQQEKVEFVRKAQSFFSETNTFSKDGKRVVTLTMSGEDWYPLVAEYLGKNEVAEPTDAQKLPSIYGF